MYSGPQTAPARRVTLRTVRAKHARGEPLTMVTAYDYPSAVHVPPPLATVVDLNGCNRTTAESGGCKADTHANTVHVFEACLPKQVFCSQLNCCQMQT